ncbi:MAG: metal-dependent transcriptional regulator [Candidatus Omnitrophota bacterium]
MEDARDTEQELSASLEDYLEAIALIRQENSVARVKDISLFMNVKKPSVTGALKVLSDKGLVAHEKYGYVDLTEKGEVVAGKVLNRHRIIVKFLNEILNIDSETAAQDACRMEHAISSRTFVKLGKFIEFVESCTQEERPGWLKNFDIYCKKEKTDK